MKYLVTGGCGFLGANLSREVLRRGDELIIFDNLSRAGSRQNLEWLKSQRCFVHGDIRHLYEVEQVIQRHRPDVIFHVAGQVAMTTSLDQPRLDFEINALGTLNLLEALRCHAPRASLIYSSTNKVYGDLETVSYREEKMRYVAPAYPKGFDETLPLQFRTPYGCSKGAAEQYVLDYHKTYGIRSVVCRHSTIYGDRQYATFDQGWIGWFCQMAQKMKDRTVEPFSVAGNGKQVRDVLHVDDAVACYFSLVDNIEAAEGECFNIGGGAENSLSLLELFSLLEELTGVTMRYHCLPPRISDQKIFIANVEKIKRYTGWKPQISAREGMMRMMEWQNAL